MRSARMVLATATATAALAIAAPAAYADHTGDDGHDTSSYSKEHDKESKHDKPHGGMHTGGGALAAVSEDDWGTAKDPKYDPETYKDKGDSQKEEESWGGKQDTERNHDKPRGGMHTGGGGLAEPGVTAGGLAALGVLGAGAFALRRKKAAGDVA